MDLGLTNRTVIVTGASGGIGRHIARGFAAEGADVVITYRNSRSDAEQVAKEIGDRTLLIGYDLSDPAAPTALVKQVLDWTGRIDVLVNNAVNWGADGLPQGHFEDAPDDYWLPVLRANIEGALRLTRTVAPVLRERRWGRLVHVSSSVAEDGMPSGEYYGAAKAALHGFSKSAAIGLGRDGDILSNVVMPGLTRTDRNTEITDAFGDHYSALAPIGRLLDAAEVAGAVVYLGSAANTGITGQVIRVTGGA
ncbi:SDR family NAD(P)-dependent oxidoreductase [Phytohabitans rumicis]|uniref:Putative 3-oxoacyl-[acyl-carrier protein] reductase n=1 Tax=Phytohabitans rumicis TaxID=1076125 RepID=A0A6V8LJI3_9ACTN|nr:SDR family oxidoreductase [Phytohabitans rumicis]GFJ95028.1 putative 3-oxoacyl-[acyl-carrier protein] reductase [Phytohabitans rumicis]